MDAVVTQFGYTATQLALVKMAVFFVPCFVSLFSELLRNPLPEFSTANIERSSLTVGDGSMLV